MVLNPLDGKVILVTGAARRIGRALALACGAAGADVIVHYHTAAAQADQIREQLRAIGRRAWVLRADLEDADEAVRLVEAAFEAAPVYGLVNNAAIFAAGAFAKTSRKDWDAHLQVNLTAPFLISQAFAERLGPDGTGRIVNILDWRALRPGYDHFAYTISKAALATLTESMALALAPRIAVNGLALGAILPPENEDPGPNLIKRVPAGRWGTVEEVAAALVFVMADSGYITGEIIHVDGGRHLV